MSKVGTLFLHFCHSNGITTGYHGFLLRNTKESVAVKIIDKTKLLGKEGMMLNEIKIMRKLDHESCVKLVSNNYSSVL